MTNKDTGPNKGTGVQFQHTLYPAYGRDYEDPVAVAKDLVKDKDFSLRPGTGPYTNRADLLGMGFQWVEVNYGLGGRETTTFDLLTLEEWEVAQEHDPDGCGCAYMGNDSWSCGHQDNAPDDCKG